MDAEKKTKINKFKVSWPGHDEISIEICLKTRLVTSLKVMGCVETLNYIKDLSQKFKTLSVFEWPIPLGSSHSEMLIRELLLKVNKSWDYPYKEAELCHCRLVPTCVVDQAVLGGAHTSLQVTMATGAASGCSACQVNIDKIIQYRLKNSA